MGSYFLSDISTSFSGDIQLDSKGDIGLANSVDTQKALTNFWLRTDHGEYVANPAIGCNLGSFIGSTNTRSTLGAIENQTYNTLVRNLWFPEDIQLKVVPMDTHEVMIAIQLKGEFFDEQGNPNIITPVVIAYSFPYIEGTVSPLIE